MRSRPGIREGNRKQGDHGFRSVDGNDAKRHSDAGKALINFLTSPAARDTIVNSGLEPIVK
jgi:hypothetical protein